MLLIAAAVENWTSPIDPHSATNFVTFRPPGGVPRLPYQGCAVRRECGSKCRKTRVTVNAKVATRNAILAQVSAAPLRSSPSLASEATRSQSHVHMEGNVCSTKL